MINVKGEVAPIAGLSSVMAHIKWKPALNLHISKMSIPTKGPSTFHFFQLDFYVRTPSLLLNVHLKFCFPNSHYIQEGIAGFQCHAIQNKSK